MKASAIGSIRRSGAAPDESGTGRHAECCEQASLRLFADIVDFVHTEICETDTIP